MNKKTFFLTMDTTLQPNNPLRFRKTLFESFYKNEINW